MSKQSTLELCRKHLYDDKDSMTGILPAVRDRIIRIRAGFTFWNDFPRKKEKEIAQHIMQMYNVEKSTAYDDIRLIKDLLGSINKASKDWHLYRFNQMIEKGYEIAELKNDPDSIAKIASAYGKYNKLDKEDPTEFPWDDIKPQSFVITSDPSVIGIKPIPNLKDKIAKLLEKYKPDIEMVEDVTYEDVDVDPILEKYGEK
jgi:hypothetical protein